MHKVLERQLRSLSLSSDGSVLPTREQFRAFLDRVSHAYAATDQDRYTYERSMELSSREMHDLHRRLASERDKLRSIFEAAALGILSVGPAGEILEANPAALDMLGLPLSALVGRTFASLFPDDVAREPRASGPGPSAAERRFRREDGRVAWLNSTESWLKGASSEPGLGTVVIEDVTAKKELEGSLRHAQKLESVGRLAAGVAHEINTPIQFISDNVHFLETAFGTLGALVAKLAALTGGLDEARSQIRAAKEEADWCYLKDEVPKSLSQTLEGLGRVSTIVRSMKSFAYNDHGEQSLTDLNAVLESTLAMASHELKGVAVVTCALGDIPHVMCCRGDLGQVFLNLLVNAAHAIADHTAGTGKIGAVKLVTLREGDDVIASISDTRGGIPDAVKAKLFEPFFTTKTVGRGSGQGLALARSVVEKKHGGALSFESEVGAGTTFRVRLPIAGRRASAREAA